MQVLNPDPQWDVVVVKSANQTVTNSATLTNDTELAFDAAINEVWHVMMRLGFASSAVSGADGKLSLASSVAAFVTAQSNWEGVYYNAVGTLTTKAPTAFDSTTLAMSPGVTALETGSPFGGTITPIFLQFRIRFSAAATATLQFAQVTATAGQSVTMQAGSTLTAKRMLV